MIEFFQWMRDRKSAEKPWLICGKGPSFERRAGVDLTAFNVLTLNHAAREVDSLVAHMIDIDVLDGISRQDRDRAQFFVLPMHPHVTFNATSRRLPEFFSDYPELRALNDDGRLLWYNLSTWRVPDPKSPVVNVRFFSAEAAVRLLAMAGVRIIRTIGVDGGNQYAKDFKDLQPLTGGHASFNAQWDEIRATVAEYRLDFARLYP